MFVVLFLLIGAFFIISNDEIYLIEEKGFSEFFDRYCEWLDGLVENCRSVSGYVVKMEWLPEGSE